MGLTLADGVYQVRVKLGEQIPNFWSNEDIIYDLNYAAQDMCSAAQNLEDVTKFDWPNVPGTASNPIEEAPLAPFVDQILAVSIFSGQTFQLQQLQDWTDVQVASKVGNIPIMFYTKVGTQKLSPQGAGSNSGDINVFPLQPNLPEGQDYTTVLGLWPVPQSNYPTTVWFTKFHPFVTNPKDPIGIPAMFSRGWVAYATARAKEKESAFDEANYYQGIYDQQKEMLVNYAISRKALKNFPDYGGTNWPSLARGSSSIIFIDQSPGII